MQTRSWLVVFMCGVALLSACHPRKGAQSSSSIPSAAKEFKTVYFDFDQSSVRSDQTSSVEYDSGILKNKSSLKVTIEGSCDDRGTNEYNLALGDRRAGAVKNYLINLGIDPSRLSTVSYGEEKPACTEQDESCWWKNRRADFMK